MSDQPILEAFDLIRRYAERQGWVPIGFRTFTIAGEWQVTVNGTKAARDEIPPYHARIENLRYIGMLLLSPFRGSAGGYKDTEGEFLAAMRQAVSVLPERVV